MDNFAKDVHFPKEIILRTQAQALADVKKMDPDTALTAYYLRQLIIRKKIKTLKAGNKYLVNMHSLYEYLANPEEEEEEKPQESSYGTLRKIKG